MSNDEFSKLSGTFIEGVATAAGAAGLAAALGPGEAMVATAALGTAVEWFRRIREQNNERFDACSFDELEENVRKLDERVRKLEADAAVQGKSEAPWSPLTRNAVYSEFVRAVAEAPTPEKREALVNAAAHLRDPRIGDQSTRQYWWAVIRGLSDAHLAAIRWVGKSAVAKGKEPGQYARSRASDSQKVKRVVEVNSFPDDGSILEETLPTETALPVEAVLTEMTFSEFPLFFASRSSHGDRVLKAGDTLTLAPRGHIVLRMISDP